MTKYVTLATLASIVVLSMVPLQAEARLENNVPLFEQNQTVPESNLVLTFPVDIDLSGTSVELLDANSKNVPIEKLEFSGKASDVSVPLREPLLPGIYTVKWQARAQDGRESSGTYFFEVGN